MIENNNTNKNKKIKKQFSKKENRKNANTRHIFHSFYVLQKKTNKKYGFEIYDKKCFKLKKRFCGDLNFKI